jgi:hypothetical protein
MHQRTPGTTPVLPAIGGRASKRLRNDTVIRHGD